MPNIFDVPFFTLRISSNMFSMSEADVLALSSHIPGLTKYNSIYGHEVLLNHEQNNEVKLEKFNTDTITAFNIDAPYSKSMPADMVHLSYGILRAMWLEKHLCPIHAACVGSAEKGYSLIVGPAGAGKTSTALDLVLNKNLQLFSGDKTLIQFTANGDMHAIAGTQTMTLRNEDRIFWPEIKDDQGETQGDRFIFKLLDNQYCTENSVKISGIYLLKLHNDEMKLMQLSRDSALHQLYKYFTDTERADVCIGQDDNKALFDGNVSSKARATINTKLNISLMNVPAFNISGTREAVVNRLGRICGPQKKILFGICGLGSGHTFRQLPIIKATLEAGHKIAIFAYDSSLEYFRNYFANRLDIPIIEVADHFLVGNANGIDQPASRLHPRNNKDFDKINMTASKKLKAKFGIPDLIISDYNQFTGILAIINNIPLITVDQQSKFLFGDFPNIKEFTCNDERARLKEFFPKANKRIAMSFFDVEASDARDWNVEIIAPFLRPEIVALKNAELFPTQTILVYSSSLYTLDIDQITEIFAKFPQTKFVIFLPKNSQLKENTTNLEFHLPNDAEFLKHFAGCHGVIATAGHSLLAEAMFLNKPVFAIPAAIYEQQYNAKVIADNYFGVNESNINEFKLYYFLTNLVKFAKNIKIDQQILLRDNSEHIILDTIEKMLEQGKPKSKKNYDKSRSSPTLSI